MTGFYINPHAISVAFICARFAPAGCIYSIKIVYLLFMSANCKVKSVTKIEECSAFAFQKRCSTLLHNAPIKSCSAAVANIPSCLPKSILIFTQAMLVQMWLEKTFSKQTAECHHQRPIIIRRQVRCIPNIQSHYKQVGEPISSM